MISSILIVEDEGIVALELAESMRRLGYEIAGVADTGEKAVALAGELAPDLIIMDVRLKGAMDGIEAASIIRRNHGTPVIYLTAYSGDDIVERAKVTEPYGYLLKPVQEEALETAIRMAAYKHLRDREVLRDLSSLSSALGAFSAGIVVADLSLRIAYVNAKAEDITGIPSGKATGRALDTVMDLGGPQLKSEMELRIPEVLSEGRSFNLDDHHILRRGSFKVPVSVELAPLRAADGTVSGLLVTIRDSRDATLALERSKYEASVEPADRPLIEGDDELRSYLEIEIVRLMMDASTSVPPVNYFREGQIAALKQILGLMFGQDSLEEFVTSVLVS